MYCVLLLLSVTLDGTIIIVFCQLPSEVAMCVFKFDKTPISFSISVTQCILICVCLFCVFSVCMLMCMLHASATGERS